MAETDKPFDEGRKQFTTSPGSMTAIVCLGIVGSVLEAPPRPGHDSTIALRIFPGNYDPMKYTPWDQLAVPFRGIS
jgi:hypothetical protein